MARFNKREARETKPAATGKAIEISKRIKKTKAAEPAAVLPAKPMLTLKAKIAGNKPESIKLARKFFSEYRKQEEGAIKDKNMNKAERAKFLKKSALLRRKKLGEYLMNPEMPISLNEISKALDAAQGDQAKQGGGKISNKAFVRDQTTDLDKMHKIAQHPVFKANPIETLKRHLKNTLHKN